MKTFLLSFFLDFKFKLKCICNQFCRSFCGFRFRFGCLSIYSTICLLLVYQQLKTMPVFFFILFFLGLRTRSDPQHTPNAADVDAAVCSLKEKIKEAK